MSASLASIHPWVRRIWRLDDLSGSSPLTKDVVAALRGARILLTGASGFVGSHVLEALMALNEAYLLELEVFAGSRTPHRPPSHVASRFAQAARVRWVDSRDHSWLIKNPTITHLVHAAAASEASEARALLDAVTQKSSTVIPLFLSSGAVYGRGTGRFSESDPLAPTTRYGATKVEIEAFWLKHERGVSARIFALSGRRLPEDRQFALGNFVAQARAGQDIIVKGSGQAERSYLDGSDLAQWLLTILVRGRPGIAYNVGSDQAVSILSLAQEVERVGRERGYSGAVRVLNDASGVQALAPEHYVPVIDRARTELGLEPRITLSDSIRSMWDVSLDGGAKQ